MKPKFTPGKLPMFYGTYARNFEYARQNRNKPTPAEDVLWSALKNKQLKGLKFRRQHPIGVFIVDFYCHTTQLAIELDGAYHLEANQQEYDQHRTMMLQEAGIDEIRFSNEVVLNDLESVLKKILEVIESK
jgi:very-short-patch-repair endonuclease